MYVKRWLRMYRGEIRVITTLLALFLIFNISQLLRQLIHSNVTGNTLSTNIENTAKPLPTEKNEQSLVIPTTIQINIYINNTIPIYNQVYTSILTQIPSLVPSTNPILTVLPTQISTLIPSPTPTRSITPTPGISKFEGKYYNNLDLIGEPLLVRTDDQIIFDWGSGSPDKLINNDNFAIVWVGYLQSEGGNYQLTFAHDDGMRIYINNNLIHDHWVRQAYSEETENITLIKGKHEIKVEYFEKWTNASVLFDIKKM